MTFPIYLILLRFLWIFVFYLNSHACMHVLGYNCEYFTLFEHFGSVDIIILVIIFMHLIRYKVSQCWNLATLKLCRNIAAIANVYPDKRLLIISNMFMKTIHISKLSQVINFSILLLMTCPSTLKNHVLVPLQDFIGELHFACFVTLTARYLTGTWGPHNFCIAFLLKFQ